jgi:hypothetical protein
LAVSKQAVRKFDVDRFNLRKLNELEVRKQYQNKVSNMFAALENSHVSEDINRAWENSKDINRTSAKRSLCLYELRQNKTLYL